MHDLGRSIPSHPWWNKSHVINETLLSHMSTVSDLVWIVVRWGDMTSGIAKSSVIRRSHIQWGTRRWDCQSLSKRVTIAAQQITHNQVTKTSNSNNHHSFIHDDIYFDYEFVIYTGFGGHNLLLLNSGSFGAMWRLGLEILWSLLIHVSCGRYWPSAETLGGTAGGDTRTLILNLFMEHVFFHSLVIVFSRVRRERHTHGSGQWGNGERERLRDEHQAETVSF